ncbi:hypothetical protein NXS19_003869 [Fusarium pseudograminearum]|nr:hypothetical protein NXS19_003869 [Fusarium pseudograminearum]
MLSIPFLSRVIWFLAFLLFSSLHLVCLPACLASLFIIRLHRYIALLFSLDNRNPSQSFDRLPPQSRTLSVASARLQRT